MNNENELKQTAESKHGEIVFLASQIWEREGKPSGRDEEIWLQAEAQLFADRKNDAESSKIAAKTKPSTEPRIEVVEKARVPLAKASAGKNGVKR